MTRIQWIASIAVGSLVMAGISLADEVKLKNGQQITARVMQKDAEAVYLEVPRDQVESINGVVMPPPIGPGAQAPDFAAIDRTGKTQRLLDNNGKPTLVQFWASWCPHCRADVAYLKQLAAKYEPKGFRILTISVDQDEAALKKYLENEPISYPIIDAAKVPTLSDQYEMQGIPAYYLVDGKGKILKRWSGEINKRSEELEPLIDQALSS